jgi:flagellin-like protein
MKGISPLVASVMLIAFTIAVAGIISIWLTSFAKTTTEEVTERATTEIECVYGGISLHNLKFCKKNGWGFLSGFLENTRLISLGEITIHAIYDNGTIQKTELCLIDASVEECATANLSIAPNEEFLFNITTGSNYEKIRVSTNCSGVTDDVSRGDVSLTC